MTIDWTKPIETVDGRPARVLCQDFKAPDGNCVLVAILQDGQEYMQRLRPEGCSWPYLGTDIIRNKRIKREGWLNLYRTADGGVRTSVIISRTREDAMLMPSTGVATRLDPVRIEWEE